MLPKSECSSVPLSVVSTELWEETHKEQPELPMEARGHAFHWSHGDTRDFRAHIDTVRGDLHSNKLTIPLESSSHAWWWDVTDHLSWWHINILKKPLRCMMFEPRNLYNLNHISVFLCNICLVHFALTLPTSNSQTSLMSDILWIMWIMYLALKQNY